MQGWRQEFSDAEANVPNRGAEPEEPGLRPHL